MQHRNEQPIELMTPASRLRARLPRIAWLCWAALVAATGYISWQIDQQAGRPFNPLGTGIHCTLAALLGLLLLTWLEVRLTGGLDA